MTNYSLHPERKTPRFRPFKALYHMRKLVQDKENTEQFFHMMEALNGAALINRFDDFMRSPEGQARFEMRRYLPPVLDDHSWIKDLPEDSLGQAYIRFMREEELTAQGLVEESDKFRENANAYEDDFDWYTKRLRDTHDMFHILTGYGRDPLGEACLLGFTHPQHKARGFLIVGVLATLEVKKRVKNAVNVWPCFKEGRRNGKLAKVIAEHDIIELMHLPIESARERLGIRPATAYHAVIMQMSSQGIEPNALDDT